MNGKLKYVRPIMAIDAAHMRSESKGTLYIATVLSSNNEILPIAITITSDNENYDGWKYFLTNLKKSCKIIDSNHTDCRYRPYKLFSFISDRDKGIIEACKEIFPDNNHSYCQVHIRRNVRTLFGKKAGSYIPKIGRTFLSRREGYWLNKLKENHPIACDYVEGITPQTWQSATWMALTNLPRRYGITSSNNAESTNSMFNRARDLN